MPLTKKERRYYSKLLAQKLLQLGIKDELNMKATGRNRYQLKSRTNVPQSTNQLTPEQISEYFNVTPTFTAQNVHRNLIKRMLKLTPQQIETFLRTNLNQKEEADGSELKNE